MDAPLSPEQRFELITRDLKEVIGGDEIKQMLLDGKDPKLYWGTATTGKPHLGYFVPIFKIADFLKAGCHVTILFADLHAFLDNLKSSWEQLKFRCEWYELVIKEMLKLIGVPLDKLKFVKGTDFQLSKAYTLDMYKMSAVSTCASCTHAGAEVVKKAVESPLMSAMLYPILQALDEVHLDVDIQFGGYDQRKIFMFARQALPKIGYKKRCHLMNPLVPGLGKSGKMSSSEPNSKVDFDDSNKVIKKKFASAYSVDGVVEDNGLMAIMKHVIFKFLHSKGKAFDFTKPEKWGGESFSFATYEEMESAFINGDIISSDFKPALALAIIDLISPLRDVLRENKTLMINAYGEASSLASSGKGLSLSSSGKGVSRPITFSILDAKVGEIKEALSDKDNDKLYTVSVDVGGESPISTASALREAYTAEELVGTKCAIVCNLPKTQGTILRAVEGTSSELVGVPSDASIGSPITAQGEESDPELPSVSKRRADRLFKKMLSVNKDGVVVCNGVPLVVGGEQLTGKPNSTIPGR